MTYTTTDSFNSRSRVGSDLHPVPCKVEDYGFNSRSRVGSDQFSLGVQTEVGVSIHAPAWGATERVLLWRRFYHCFNSRSRVGSDPKAHSIRETGVVSIHAPAWGATR